MRKAHCLIRPQPVYRREAFMAGLAAAGYDVRTGAPGAIEGGDVVVMWNRYAENHALALRYEAAGAVVLIAENGYLGRGGVSPHATDPREWYALAIGGHNGSGTWPSGGPERWNALDIELQPWRTQGAHILVCPNRSFGRPDLIMPPRWAENVAKRLAAVTLREIRIRPHPGNYPAKVPLAQDLAQAWACVIWTSSAGVHALIAGVPVICEGPFWICKHAAFTRLWAELDDAQAADRWCSAALRQRALERLAWAQWHVDEIARGDCFRHLLSDTRQAESCAAV